MNKPIIIIGGGGHAAMLLEILLKDQRNVIAYSSPVISTQPLFNEIMWYCQDGDILSFNTNDVELVMGVGSLPNSSLRIKLYNKFKQLGYSFSTIISESALVSAHAILSEGVQVLPRAVINCTSEIQENTIINSGAIVEHDCRIGAHNHIASGAILCGGVTTGTQVHIGAGATIIQLINIADNVTIGAGATVTKDVTNGCTIFPAKNHIQQPYNG